MDTVLDTDEPTNDVKRILITQEIALWTNTRYQLQIRLRIAKRVGDTTEDQATYINGMARCEKALDALREELDALVSTNGVEVGA